MPLQQLWVCGFSPVSLYFSMAQGLRGALVGRPHDHLLSGLHAELQAGTKGNESPGPVSVPLGRSRMVKGHQRLKQSTVGTEVGQP